MMPAHIVTMSHTRIDTGVLLGYTHAAGVLLGYTHVAHWVYTRITPVALDIYEDNTHIKPSIGHSINTGTHMCIFVRKKT